MNKVQKNIQYGIFILLFSLYVGYNYIDFTATSSKALHIGDMIKYFSIVVCFALALLNSKFAVDRKDAIFVNIALAFTLLSDTFILCFKRMLWGLFVFVLSI